MPIRGTFAIVAQLIEVYSRLVTVVCGPTKSAFGNWKSKCSEGHDSLDVTWRVDVFSQGILDFVKRGVAVCN